jgi:hypothetical protein
VRPRPSHCKLIRVLPSDALAAAVPPAPSPTERTRAQDRLLLAVSLAAVAVPFLAVRLPPIADLPQQVAQIRLLADAWGDPAGPWAIDGFGPNRLAYLVLGGSWALVGPRDAGRLAMLAIGIGWVAAAHLIARRRGRSSAAAVLASILFFNHATYWGFYAFALGAPIFAGWVHLTDRLPARLSWRARGALLAGALLLFLAHALWFAAGLAWLGLSALPRGGVRPAFARLATVAPVIACAALWAGGLGGTAFDAARIPPVWETGLLDRVDPRWLAQATLGGLRGRVEGIALLGLALWGVAGALGALWRRRAGRAATAREGGLDGTLLLAAALLVAATLLLPSKTASTIGFAQRWMPMAAFLALLALPAPALPRRAAVAAVSAAALLFAGLTGRAWRTFEQVELAGLEESVAAVAPWERVLGLDFVKKSPTVRGRPFLQAFAWAQVLHGSPLAFTFAEFPSSLVQRARPAPEPWTPNLVWYAERVRREDLRWFDVVLVNADAAAHARIASELALLPVTTGSGRWRLYRTAASAPTRPSTPGFLARHSVCSP